VRAGIAAIAGITGARAGCIIAAAGLPDTIPRPIAFESAGEIPPGPIGIETLYTPPLGLACEISTSGLAPPTSRDTDTSPPTGRAGGIAGTATATD